MRLIDIEDPAPRSSSRTLVRIWASWTAVVAVLLAFHEMWRDELQAWTIARTSSTPLDVLSNIRYEGHPPAWYFLLWAASRVSSSPVASQVVTAVVGSAAAWIVLRYAPFTLTVRVLLVAGYFPLYELGVISRSYGLLYLTVVAFLALADRRDRLSWELVVLLLVAAATLVIALPLVAALAVGQWIRRRGVDLRRGAVILGAVAAVCVLIVLVTRFPSDGHQVEIDASSSQVAIVTRTPLRAAVPMPLPILEFWNRFVTEDLGAVEPWIGIAVAAAITVALRRSRAALAVWLISAAGYLLFVSIVLSGELPAREIFPLWLGAFAAVWIAAGDAIARRRTAPERSSPAWMVLAALVLVAAVCGTAWAAFTDLREPFSGGESAAAWISSHTDPHRVILCATAIQYCSTVAMRLDEPMSMRADGPPSTFVVWRRHRPAPLTRNGLITEAAKLHKQTGREVVIVARLASAPDGCAAGFVSEKPIVPRERMVVCRADQLIPYER